MSVLQEKLRGRGGSSCWFDRKIGTKVQHRWLLSKHGVPTLLLGRQVRIRYGKRHAAAAAAAAAAARVRGLLYRAGAKGTCSSTGIPRSRAA